MKSRLKKLIRVFGFTALLIALVISSSYMLAPKDNTKEGGIVNPSANGFFSEPKGTIDISVIGNSDAYSGFSPMELWNSYGYTAYVSGEGSQTVAQAYSMLSKVLKVQTPKVVILETDGFFTKSKVVENAAKIVNASLGSSFSVFQYHDRWKKVKIGELFKKPHYTGHCAPKGQWLSNDVKGYNGKEYMKKTDKSAEIPLGTKHSAEAFVKTCRDKNIEVLFLELPSQSSWNYKKHNAVKKYADELGVTFIDMNIDRERFDFNWKTDTRDGGNHLNSKGARKFTLFLGKYLEEKYNLTDHRKDKKYSRWNEDFKDYSKNAKI